MGNNAVWVRVSRAEPCVICAHPDWCGRTADGTAACCMRVESDTPMGGENAGYLHRLSGSEVLPERKPKPEVERHISFEGEANQCFLSGDNGHIELLARNLGVTADALRLMRCGWGLFGGMGYCWTFPEKDHLGRVIGISLRMTSGSKRMVEGSKRGLVYLDNWDTYLGPTLIVEGASDVAACISMGFSVIGRPSNIGGANMIAKMLDARRPRPVLVIGERDEKPEKRGEFAWCPDDCRGCRHCYPGKVGAIETVNTIARKSHHPRRMAPLRWRFPPSPFKDMREVQNSTEWSKHDLLKHWGYK